MSFIRIITQLLGKAHYPWVCGRAEGGQKRKTIQRVLGYLRLLGGVRSGFIDNVQKRFLPILLLIVAPLPQKKIDPTRWQSKLP